MEIGKAIIQLRKKKGLTQKDFSIKCGLSNNAVCQIEIGNVFPNKTTIEKMSKVLNVPISYILFFSITVDDVPDDKKQVFNSLSGLKDLLIS
jgi:transcriptional regulator with XRE-family HTH domain